MHPSGYLKFAVRRDDEGIQGQEVGNVWNMRFLVYRGNSVFAEAFRLLSVESFASQSQPRSKILKKRFEMRLLETASSKSSIAVVVTRTFESHPIVEFCSKDTGRGAFCRLTSTMLRSKFAALHVLIRSWNPVLLV